MHILSDNIHKGKNPSPLLLSSTIISTNRPLPQTLTKGTADDTTPNEIINVLKDKSTIKNMLDKIEKWLEITLKKASNAKE